MQIWLSELFWVPLHKLFLSANLYGYRCKFWSLWQRTRLTTQLQLQLVFVKDYKTTTFPSSKDYSQATAIKDLDLKLCWGAGWTDPKEISLISTPSMLQSCNTCWIYSPDSWDLAQFSKYKLDGHAWSVLHLLRSPGQENDWELPAPRDEAPAKSLRAHITINPVHEPHPFYGCSQDSPAH